MRLLEAKTPTFTRIANKYSVLVYAAGCLLPVHLILGTLLLWGVHQDTLKPFKLLFALLPTAVAMFVTYLRDGEVGVVNLWKQLFVRSTAKYLYVITLLVFPFIAVIAIYFRQFYDGYVHELYSGPTLTEAFFLVPFLLLFPGFTEEFGWRGFMQQKLQQKLPLLVSALAVGFVWGGWHCMDFFMGNWPASTGLVVIFFLYIMGTSLIIGFFYKKSKNSVSIAIIGHFSANIVNFFFPIWDESAGNETAAIFIGLLWCVGLLLALLDYLFSTRKGS